MAAVECPPDLAAPQHTTSSSTSIPGMGAESVELSFEESAAKRAKIDPSTPPTPSAQPAGATSAAAMDTPGGSTEKKMTVAEEKRRAAEKEELRRKDPKERRRLRERLSDLKTKDIRKWLRELISDGKQQSYLYFRDRPLTNVFSLDVSTQPEYILDVALVEKEMNPYFEADASKLFAVSYTNVEKSIQVTIDKPAWTHFLTVANKVDQARAATHEYEVCQALSKLNKRDADLADGLAHWKVANNVLKRLDSLDLSNELIKKTKIGLAVNPYQHHTDPNIGIVAKTLLKKWRTQYKFSEKNLFGTSKEEKELLKATASASQENVQAETAGSSEAAQVPAAAAEATVTTPSAVPAAEATVTTPAVPAAEATPAAVPVPEESAAEIPTESSASDSGDETSDVSEAPAADVKAAEAPAAGVKAAEAPADAGVKAAEVPADAGVIAAEVPADAGVIAAEVPATHAPTQEAAVIAADAPTQEAAVIAADAEESGEETDEESSDGSEEGVATES